VQQPSGSMGVCRHSSSWLGGIVHPCLLRRRQSPCWRNHPHYSRCWRSRSLAPGLSRTQLPQRPRLRQSGLVVIPEDFTRRTGTTGRLLPRRWGHLLPAFATRGQVFSDHVLGLLERPHSAPEELDHVPTALVRQGPDLSPGDQAANAEQLHTSSYSPPSPHAAAAGVHAQVFRRTTGPCARWSELAIGARSDVDHPTICVTEVDRRGAQAPRR